MKNSPIIWIAGGLGLLWFLHQQKEAQSATAMPNTDMAKNIGDGFPTGWKATDGTKIPPGSYLQMSTGLIQYPDGSIHKFVQD